MPELTVLPSQKPDFSRRERLFIEKLVAAGGDLKAIPELFPNPKATRRMSMKECREMWARPEIREECESRLELEETENARQLARASRLRDPHWRDAHAVENVENAEPGAAKSRALETACVLAGVMAGRELVWKPEDGKVKPNIYRALQTTTVERVTETITQTQEVSTETPAPPLPALDSADEILEY
jgi:hypothetical protein